MELAVSCLVASDCPPHPARASFFSISSCSWLGWIFCFQVLFCLLVASSGASVPFRQVWWNSLEIQAPFSPGDVLGTIWHRRVPPKRTRIPFSQHETENHLAAWREKRPSFLWGLIRSKCGTTLLRFCWGGSYTHKSKDVPISTYGLVEMMPKGLEDTISQSQSQRPHIHGPTGRRGLIEIQQQLRVSCAVTQFSRNTRTPVPSGKAEFYVYITVHPWLSAHFPTTWHRLHFIINYQLIPGLITDKYINEQINGILHV